jgi:hypothetical protein
MEINREAPAAGDELPAIDGRFLLPAGKNNGSLAKNPAGGTIPSTKLTTTFFWKVVLRARFFPPDRRAFFLRRRERYVVLSVGHDQATGEWGNYSAWRVVFLFDDCRRAWPLRDELWFGILSSNDWKLFACMAGTSLI